MFVLMQRVLLIATLIVFFTCEVKSKERTDRWKRSNDSRSTYGSSWNPITWFIPKPRTITSYLDIFDSLDKISKSNDITTPREDHSTPPDNESSPPYPGLGSGKHEVQNCNNSPTPNQKPLQTGLFGNPVNGPFGIGYRNNNYGTGFGLEKNNGFGSLGSHIRTFITGTLLWRLATGAEGNNYHLFHNTKEQYVNMYQSEDTNHGYNIRSNMDNPNKAKIEVNLGNITCLTIYNAKKFSEWANETIKDVETQTNQTFPFNLNINDTSVQFNFTLELGEIKHNETISITCCGAEQMLFNCEDALKGHGPNTNCVHMINTIPFRHIKVVPLNRTLKVTQKEINDLNRPKKVDNITLNLNPSDNLEDDVFSSNEEHITLNLGTPTNYNNAENTPSSGKNRNHLSNVQSSTAQYQFPVDRFSVDAVTDTPWATWLSNRN